MLSRPLRRWRGAPYRLARWMDAWEWGAGQDHARYGVDASVNHNIHNNHVEHDDHKLHSHGAESGDEGNAIIAPAYTSMVSTSMPAY